MEWHTSLLTIEETNLCTHIGPMKWQTSILAFGLWHDRLFYSYLNKVETHFCNHIGHVHRLICVLKLDHWRELIIYSHFTGGENYFCTHIRHEEWELICVIHHKAKSRGAEDNSQKSLHSHCTGGSGRQEKTGWCNRDFAQVVWWRVDWGGRETVQARTVLPARGCLRTVLH